jgi:hypothetical protein
MSLARQPSLDQQAPRSVGIAGRLHWRKFAGPSQRHENTTLEPTVESTF